MSQGCLPSAPFGYDSYTHVEVIPKPAPRHLRWRIGPIQAKSVYPSPGPTGSPAQGNEEITVQLTADQQVTLSITGEDAYNNPVDVTGDVVWSSSDESVVTVTSDGLTALAVAVGPTGTAAITVNNDVNADGTADFQGSLAIDVVAGEVAEIVISAGTPENKPVQP